MKVTVCREATEQCPKRVPLGWFEDAYYSMLFMKALIVEDNESGGKHEYVMICESDEDE